MSNSTVVASIDAQIFLGANNHEGCPLEMAGVRSLCSHEQFGVLQQAISTALLSAADFAGHEASVDDLDELSHVRPSGDFVAVIA